MTTVQDTSTPEPETLRYSASRRLASVIEAIEGDHVRAGDMLDRMGSSSFGFTLLTLTLLVMIPVPGPLGILLGALIGFIALQLMLGSRRLWLPEILRRRNIPAGLLRTTVQKLLPALTWLESFLTPRRWMPLSGRAARVALSLPLLGLGLAIMLPIPLGNFAPALALAVFSLGFLTRDGLAILVACALSIGAFAWTGVLLFAGAEVFGWLKDLFT
jgi:hypothetical protein